MSDPIVVENVLLRGKDLDFPWSLWRRVNRASNLRLAPIAIGFLGSACALSFMIDPSALDLLLIIGPILIGFYVFLWVTNVVFVGELKRAYAGSPLGVEPCTFTFDDEGVKQTTPYSTSSFLWSGFADVIENEKGFRFWLTPYSAVFLPSRFLNEEQRAALSGLIDRARIRGSIKGAQH